MKIISNIYQKIKRIITWQKCCPYAIHRGEIKIPQIRYAQNGIDIKSYCSIKTYCEKTKSEIRQFIVYNKERKNWRTIYPNNDYCWHKNNWKKCTNYNGNGHPYSKSWY